MSRPVTDTDALTATADISECGLYRYRLTRTWGTEPPMTFVMLNPSTADAEKDDPTIRRCMGFARREGCGGIVVVNLFALRVTRPVHLFDGSIADDAEGPLNRSAVWNALCTGYTLVAAWGAHPLADTSSVHLLVKDMPGVLCLGMTADGSPRHPLYLKSDTPLEVWP